NVYQGTSPDGETGPVNGSSLVTTTGYNVTGLVNGTTYYFRVTAVNRVGQGPASAEANAVPVTVPGMPTGLTATPGDGTVTLSWAAPGSDGGSPVTGYNVYQGTSPGGETGPVNGSSLVTSPYTVTNLVNGVTYYFRVTAVNGVGEGKSSVEAQAVPATVPGAPTGLAVTPGDGKVTLSWAAPGSDGGSPVTGYNVYYATSADFKGTAEAPGIAGTALVLEGLVNGTTYYFMVTAVNGIGEGKPSVGAQAVPVTVPGMPTGLTATPGDGKVILAWAAP